MIKGEKSQQVASARRRLIRGTFAAPAILALHSGSAIAASSSMNCVRTQVANPVYPGSTDAPDGIYVRVQLHAMFDATTGAVLRWYLSGSSVEAARFGYSKVINSFLGAGTWKQVAPQADGTVQLFPDLLGAQPVPSSTEKFDVGLKWVALRVGLYSPSTVKKSGGGGGGGGSVEIVGVVDGSVTDSSAVTGSCWTSFTGFLGTA